MAEKVNEILEKFAEMSREEKQISQDIEKAYKEYTEYCESSETDLAEKIQEIRTKMSKLQYYIDYAREHASELEQASTAFETPEGTLESIRQTIKLDSHNDMNAETLYVKATGQKLFYEEKIEKTRQLIEGSKVQAKRQYDSDIAALNDRKRKHEESVKEYVQSEEFHNYLKMLMFDKSAFNSTGTANLPDKSFISIGQRRVKLSVPVEIEPDLSLTSNGEYNAAAHTIGAPMRLPVKNGSIVYLDYDERNQQYLFGGIQRLLLNIIKYLGHNITDCLLCEPSTNSPDCLGHIALLGKGINPFIVVPQTVGEIDTRVKEFCSNAESNPTASQLSRVIVMHGFPEKYDDEVVKCCSEMFRRAEELGVLVVLTHDNSIAATEVENEIRSNALCIRSKNGGFWIEKLRESFFWYSAPSEIPEDIRREFVDRRRQMATQQMNADVPVAPSVQVPVQQTASATSESAAEPPVEPVPHMQATGDAAAENADINTDDAAIADEEPVEPADDTQDKVSADEDVSAHEDVADDNSVFDKESDAAQADDNSSAAVQGGNVRSRELSRILIGSSLGRKPAYFEIDGDISYICGKRSEERLQLTDMIISSITATTHPDDTELWVFDFGSGELMRYAQNTAPHFRFLVADGSAETALDALDSLDRELEYRINLFDENGWRNYGEVPQNEYLPRIVVVINEFPVVTAKIAKSVQFGRSYETKLNSVLKYCGNYGMHFVLIGESFSENGKAPSCFKNCTIHSAAALTSCDIDVSEMFNGFSLREGELSSLRRVPAGSVYAAVQGFGGSMVRLSNQSPESSAVYSAIPEFTADSDTYVEKYPLIINRKYMPLYEERHDERVQYISQRSSGETLLFLGEPCRLEAEYPIHLYNDFGENLLAVVPAREKNNGLSVAFAVLSSLCEQEIPVEILAFRSNPVYDEMMRIGAAQGIQVFEGDTAVGRVKELAADIAEGRHSNSFEIVLGGDTLYAAMGADDAIGNLKKALVKGPSLGVHFMLVASSVSQFGSGFFSLFKHKVVFPCSLADAEKVLREPNIELPENAFRLSGEGDEITVMPYII